MYVRYIGGMAFSGPTSLGRTGAAGAVDVPGWRRALSDRDEADMSDAQRIDAIRELEALRAAAAAAQARITADFDRSQREAARPALRRDQVRLGRSISAQIGLARRESPARGQQHLRVARALVDDMPHTLAALAAGRINEFRAMLVVKETACLSRADRRTVDRELAARLDGAGDRRVGDLAREISQRLDPASAVRRARKAEGDRRVTVRPAPDTMSNLTALLPVTQGVAVYAALRREAERLRAEGDPRIIAQLMADLLVARTTGRTVEESSSKPRTPTVEIGLVMNERTLLRGSQQPAWIPGFGPIPAPLARHLVRTADKVWLRRLFTSPESGELVAMDSRKRLFRGKLRELILWRDQTCRTPGCDAPVRHIDHPRPWARQGSSSSQNAQGLCEACNYVKEFPGWRADVFGGPGHVVEITTPTGHHYRSSAPPQPGAGPPGSPEEQLQRIIDDVA